MISFVHRSHIPDARLLEITQISLSPPRAVTPVEENSPEVAAEAAEAEAVVDLSASIQSVGVPASSSFDFMQASELETPFEDSAEWVERSDAVGHQEEQVVEPVNGHVLPDEPLATVTPPDETVSSDFPGSF
jgi:hypothetical protein